MYFKVIQYLLKFIHINHPVVDIFYLPEYMDDTD